MKTPCETSIQSKRSVIDIDTLPERKHKHQLTAWRLGETRKKLDPEGSWSSRFWQDRLEYSDEILGVIDEEHSIVERALDIAVEALGPVQSRRPETWKIDAYRKALRDLPIRKAVEQDMKAFLIRLIDNYRLLMSNEPHRTQFISMFMASSLGTGMSLEYRNRPYDLRECWATVNEYDQKLHSVQCGMIKDCIRAYSAMQLPVDHPNWTRGFWDSISGSFTGDICTVPAYMFSEKHGQELMSKIYRTNDEMYTAKNGILISDLWAEYLDTGFFAIVPDVDDLCDRRELRAWQRSDPREYKIKILDFEHEAIDRATHCYDSRTYRSFDNHRLTFRSNARPRARYVYWQYCLNMLMRSYSRRTRHPDDETSSARSVLEDTEKVFWGSRGTYTQDSWLDALSNELGRRWADDVSDTSSVITKSCLVASGLVTQVVQSTLLPHEKEEQEDYEELVRGRAATRCPDPYDSE